MRNGYTYTEALNSYVLPIEENGYINLLVNKVEYNLINEWVKDIDMSSFYEEPIIPNYIEFEELWIKSTKVPKFFHFLDMKNFGTGDI